MLFVTVWCTTAGKYVLPAQNHIVSSVVSMISARKGFEIIQISNPDIQSRYSELKSIQGQNHFVKIIRQNHSWLKLFDKLTVVNYNETNDC